MDSRLSLQAKTRQIGALSCTTVAPEMSDVSPRYCVILCHGFGAPGTDLVPLSSDLAAMCPQQAGSVLYVFPQAPLDLEDLGLPGGRAWWMIDIERFQRAIERPDDLARMRREVPRGMPESSALLRELMSEVGRQTEIPAARTILGGFSQGAMLATDVALRLGQSPAALCVFSGTLVAEDEWRPLARKRGALPVLQSHGRFDPILPYAGAESLRQFLTAAGLKVDFIPFAGPHTIPFEALERLAALMRRLFV
jgi:phospholipase/carboxylesterase